MLFALAAGPRLGRTDPAGRSVAPAGWRRTQSMPQNYAGGARAQIQARSAANAARKIINARRRSFEDDLRPQPTLPRTVNLLRYSNQGQLSSLPSI